ncbi:MAG TPA: S8 family serine peptidase, partial [Thermomicrobiales bacterium]|nr:S8 family serine peptidase [Thermomicrobiales bacterium]
ESIGVAIEHVGVEMIEAYVPVAALEQVAAHADVLSVRMLMPPVESIISQGVALHGSPSWNEDGYTGAGVKVGVIDGGFTGITRLVGTETPLPVARCISLSGGVTHNLADCDRTTIHGTAVVETLVDVAPNVTLYIANVSTLGQLKETVNWMAAEGVTVINHSIVWLWEGLGDGAVIHPDQSLGIVDSAVDAGITWVNAAGNSARSNWFGPYLDSDSDSVLEFAEGVETNEITVQAGKRVRLSLRWDDAWPFAATDLDLLLLDPDDTVVWSSRDSQAGEAGDIPLESLAFTAQQSGKLRVSIIHYSGDLPDWLQLEELDGTPLAIATASHSIATPAESANPGMLAVGAAAWTTPTVIEPFSGQGPTRDGRIKPDVVGIDRADTVSYGPSGMAGTSQASPHVAGLAALVKQRYPSYGPVEIAGYLRSNASQACDPDNVWGYGLAHLPETVSAGHPLPCINSVTPNPVEPGTFPLTVTVNGSGFVDGSVARWNGAERPTTYVGPNQLTFEVEDLDTDVPAVVEITVSSPAPGGGVSNALTLTIADIEREPVDHAEFNLTWQRTDDPVKYLVVSRTWMWGDGAATGALLEQYADSPGGQRSVKYYDKSRMEVNDPDADPGESWYVTNGLLVVELITGEMQMGDDVFETHHPAGVPVAGDPDDEAGPTYATFAELLDAEPWADGTTIVQRVDRDGNVTHDASLAEYGVTAAELVEVPGIRHRVASPFWEFMNSTGMIYENGEYYESQLFDPWFYATGLPVTEAYWAEVKVAGEYVDVLMQCFERRCLTYTPDNDFGWQVEAGNVGLHYYTWRYELLP